MRFNKVDLNLFVVFDTIYRERNLSRSAETLNITQPAVSNALQRLRSKLDDPLFYRAGRGMAPTPVARSLAPQIQQALQLLDGCIQQSQHFDPTTSRLNFAIGLSDLGEALLMPKLLQIIKQSAPLASLQSVAIPSKELAQELLAGNIDLAVDGPFVQDTQLNHSLLVSDQYICLVRPQHPILTQDWNIKSFLSLEHIHTSSRRSGRGVVDLALSKIGKSRHITLRAQHYLTAPKIVMDSDLALCVPQLFATLYPELQQLPLPFPADKLELHIYGPKNTKDYAATIWLHEKVNETITQIRRTSH